MLSKVVVIIIVLKGGILYCILAQITVHFDVSLLTIKRISSKKSLIFTTKFSHLVILNQLNIYAKHTMEDLLYS